MTSNQPTESTLPELTDEEVREKLLSHGSDVFWTTNVVRDPVTQRIIAGHEEGFEGSDAGLIVSFRREAVESKYLTVKRQSPVPVFVDVDYITIHTPGDKLTVIDRPVTEHDKFRFPKEYAAFVTGVEAEDIGTPLSAIPGLTPAQVKQLNHYSIKTVEQMASCNDSFAGNIPGFSTVKQRAKDFLAVAAKSDAEKKLDAKLAEQSEAHKAEIEALKAQMAELIKATQPKATKS